VEEIMSYRIEEPTIDLGNTSIENIFIQEYMPQGNGTAVKVYLMAYFCAKEPKYQASWDHFTIAKNLNLPLDEVLRAWEFWEQKEIVRKHVWGSEPDEYDIEFINLKQLYFEKLMPNSQTKRKKAYSNDVAAMIATRKDETTNRMFNQISSLTRRPLVAVEMSSVLNWIRDYNMAPDVVVEAFRLAYEKKTRPNIRYVEGIIRNWYDMGITHPTELESHLEKREVDFHAQNAIRKALGLARPLTQKELAMIKVWTKEWELALELIVKACDENIKITNPNFNYTNKILERWKAEGLTTVEEVEKAAEKRTPATSKSSSQKKNSFHNFEGRMQKYSPEELENKYLNRHRNKTSDQKGGNS
jgi:DnaD/phage-associated family protein